MRNLKSIFRNAVIISIFSFILVFVTVYINDLTQHIINYHIYQEKKETLSRIVPFKMFYNFSRKNYLVTNKLLGDDKNHDVLVFFNKNMHATAAIIETIAPDGYSGYIYMIVAAYCNGKIIKVRVLSHKETPGIGDKIEVSISNWINQFNNMYISNLEDKNFLLKKKGGVIEQFTGATITPQAVVNSVKRTVIFIKTIPFII